jgi:polyphosphate kinase
VALVIRNTFSHPCLGLLATGNLNENTARFYTDHILLTADAPMLAELQMLFAFLARKKMPDVEDKLPFQHLLVARFNLQDRFLQMISREIEFARRGLPASIIIKMNNIEEEVLILKLYEASGAGVKIQLLIRGICRLVPGVAGLSEHITITRIVDRYLEHGRVFIFQNNGNEEIYLGSADWMNRNIYRRIEVCFPVHDPLIRTELKNIISMQLNDNMQAVWIDSNLQNIKATSSGASLRSQEAIYRYLLDNHQML